MDSQNTRDKSQSQGLPRFLLCFYKYLWIRNKLAPPTISPWNCREQSLGTKLSQEKRTENLSSRGCNQRLAFRQIHSLNLHRGRGSETPAMNLRWYCMKNMMRKWEKGYRRVDGRTTRTDAVCVLCFKYIEMLPDLHTSTPHLCTNCSFHLQHHHGLWNWMAQVQIWLQLN